MRWHMKRLQRKNRKDRSHDLSFLPDVLCFEFQFIVLMKISPKSVISTGAERNGEIFALKNRLATTIMRRSLDYARDDASFGGVPMN